MLRGILPRSPVWLRKIPSTVSGSQGSRRGFAPAVRFAFPLGARLNITLRARPCQELFSESFFRPSRGPRGAVAFRASALRGGEFGIIRAPAAAGAGNPPAHRMPTTPARRSGGGWRGSGAWAASAGRFAPAHRRGRFSFLYISKEIGACFGPGAFRAVATQAALPPVVGFPLLASAKLLAEEVASRKKNGRLRSTPALHAGNPLSDRPWSILYVGGFPSFRY